MSFYRIRPKSGTKVQWQQANTVLAEREIGYEIPGDGVGKGFVKMKMGDGVTAWNDLPYAQIQTVLYDGENKQIHETPITPNHNLLVNSSFRFWQRGESITPTTIKQYLADRWRARGKFDGSITCSRHGNNNGILIQNTSSEDKTSTIEQIIPLDDRAVDKISKNGLTAQCRFLRNDVENLGKKTSLNVQLLNSSRTTLFEKETSIENDGTNTVKHLVLSIDKNEIQEYLSNTKYIIFRILNFDLAPNAKSVIYCTKLEYGTIPTAMETTSYRDEFLACEERYGKRGINIRLDSTTTSAVYRYSIPFNATKTKPTIKIVEQSGDISTAQCICDMATNELQFNFTFSSTGSRKLVVIQIEYDAEIY